MSELEFRKLPLTQLIHMLFTTTQESTNHAFLKIDTGFSVDTETLVFKDRNFNLNLHFKRQRLAFEHGYLFCIELFQFDEIFDVITQMEVERTESVCLDSLEVWNSKQSEILYHTISSLNAQDFRKRFIAQIDPGERENPPPFPSD
jgi:hypothetical protein